MKLKKMTAAMIAAIGVLLPAAVGMGAAPFVSAVSAEEIAEIAMPEWVPTDFEQAVAFYNAHGTTYVSDGYICLLFTEENEHGAKTNYVVDERGGILKCVVDSVFYLPDTPDSEKKDYYNENLMGMQFRLLVYKPLKAGETTISHWNQLIDYAAVDPKYITQDRYTFSVDSSLLPTETDVFAWLPDSCEEAEEKKNVGENPVFAENGYICILLNSNDGTAYHWERGWENGGLEQVGFINCAAMEMIPRAGAARCSIVVYSPKEDGHASVKWILTDGNDGIDEIIASYEVLDNKTLLLSPTDALIEICDSETGELFDMENIRADENGAKLTAVLKYYDEDQYGITKEEMTEELISLNSNRFVNGRIGQLIGRNFSTTMEVRNADPRYRPCVTYSINTYRFENDALYIQVYPEYHAVDGDGNGDGKFSVADAVALQKWLVNGECEQIKEWKQSDCNRDGILDARDLTMMLQMLCRTNGSAQCEMMVRTDYSGCGVDGQFLGATMRYDYFTVRKGDQFYEYMPCGLTKDPNLKESYAMTEEPVLTVVDVTEEGVTVKYQSTRSLDDVEELIPYDTFMENQLFTRFIVCDGENAKYSLYFQKTE